jgi:hypothetical protein
MLKKLGISPEAAACLGELWDSTVHYIKTLYGTSDITYNSTTTTPLYGPGQGSMCGPIFWLLCYWLIISSLNPKITAARYISACKSIIIDITGVSFVDDTGLGVTSQFKWTYSATTEENYREEIKHVVQKLKDLAQHWEKLLYTTGGAINLQKSFWYLIAWNWRNGQPKLASISQRPITLSITSGHNNLPETLPRIEPTAAFRTLGVYISASGCQKKQMEVLRSHAQRYGSLLQSSTLSPSEAYLSYALYLRPKLSYPLPCTSFTPDQCRAIQAPALAALLPKLTLNRHSPRSVIFAGPKYGGLSLPDLYDDQGLGQLLLFIGHLKLEDDTGKLILSTLSHIQLYIGSSRSFFSLPTKTYGRLLEPNWITSIWSYIESANLTLEIEQLWLPKPSREGDAMIMDLATQFNLSVVQIKQLNNCRLYLQVLMLSDITEADGIHILPNMFKGRKTDDRISNLQWPNTCKPKSWAVWKLFLHYISSGTKLENRLGKWTDTTHQEWH